MFAVGHMSVAYLITRGLKGRWGSINIPLVWALSVLPDVDLLIPGLNHMGPTHSIIVALVLFLALFIYKGKVIIPYFMAYASHSILGDFITNTGTWLLWPLTSRKYALPLPFACRRVFSANLELLLFGAFLLIFVLTKDYSTLIMDKTRPILFIPFTALLVPVLFRFPIPVPLRLIPAHFILVAVVLLPFYPHNILRAIRVHVDS
jgi:membrane-bound metal-dependent hydrolase YbcI (DUF457 family)